MNKNKNMLLSFVFREKLLYGICLIRIKEPVGHNRKQLLPIRMPTLFSQIRPLIIATMLSIKGRRSQFLTTLCWIQNGSFLDKMIIAIFITIRNQILEIFV